MCTLTLGEKSVGSSPRQSNDTRVLNPLSWAYGDETMILYNMYIKNYKNISKHMKTKFCDSLWNAGHVFALTLVIWNLTDHSFAKGKAN